MQFFSTELLRSTVVLLVIQYLRFYVRIGGVKNIKTKSPQVIWVICR